MLTTFARKRTRSSHPDYRSEQYFLCHMVQFRLTRSGERVEVGSPVSREGHEHEHDYLKGIVDGQTVSSGLLTEVVDTI